MEDDPARTDSQAWLHEYNHHRPHTSIDVRTPESHAHTPGKYT
ncbi:integrase core domain-containing protein [Trueperella sp.]